MHSYNLFSLRGYFHLLHCAFFDWHAFPQPDERQEQLVLVIQGMGGVLAAVVGAGLLAQLLPKPLEWHWGDALLGVWTGTMFGLLFGVSVGITQNKFGGMRGGIAFGVAAGIMASITSAITLGIYIEAEIVLSIVLGMLLGVTASNALGAAASTSFGTVYGIIMSTPGGIAFGLAAWFAKTVTQLTPTQLAGTLLNLSENLGLGAQAATFEVGLATLSNLEWLRFLLGGVVGGGWIYFNFFAATLIGYAIASRLTAISGKAEWVMGVTALGGLALLNALVDFLVFKGFSFNLDWWHALTLVLALSLLYLRLPFWPVELIWARYTLRAMPVQAERLEQAIIRAYFDKACLLPLFGQSTTLLSLANLDFERAVCLAYQFATRSGHLLEATRALQAMARQDFLTVQAQCQREEDKNLLARFLIYVVDEQPPVLRKAWESTQHLYNSAQFLGETTESNLVNLPEIARSLQAVVANWGLAYRELPALRHMSEAIALYNLLLQALQATEPVQIADLSTPDLPVTAPLLFPLELRKTLGALQIVIAAVKTYSQASAPLTSRNALLGVNAALEVLSAGAETVNLPAGPFLRLVVAHWRRLFAAVGGALAQKRVLGPIPNPYIAGNPVEGRLFVGREGVLRRLEELWANPGQVPSVVIYGHRRMGKSSILHNLKKGNFGEHTIMVDFNLQRIGHVKHEGELLWALALAIYDNAPDFPEPEEAWFIDPARNPRHAFDRYLQHVKKLRGERRFIILLDEFEILERNIATGRLPSDLLEFWRGLIHAYPWFILAFAGLHTLRDMTHDYWNPLFGSTTQIPVSFLNPNAAEQLLIAPTPDFALDYTKDAVQRVWELTQGQPYLIQLLGHCLVARFNRQILENGEAQERRFTAADVEAVVEAPEFFREGNAYFNGVWEQAVGPAGHTLLRQLAAAPGPISGDFLCGQIAASEATSGRATLRSLCHRDVLSEVNIDEYDYTVPLMKEWVRRRDSGKLRYINDF